MVSGGQPKIPVFFEVKALNKSGRVDFVVDTGATYSALSERDAVLLSIDISSLPKARREGIGFGGRFTPRVRNKEANLIFYSTDGDQYRLKKSGLRVITAPENIDENTRKQLVARTPSILGYDILSRFELYMNKRIVELRISGKKVS